MGASGLYNSLAVKVKQGQRRKQSKEMRWFSATVRLWRILWTSFIYINMCIYSQKDLVCKAGMWMDRESIIGITPVIARYPAWVRHYQPTEPRHWTRNLQEQRSGSIRPVSRLVLLIRHACPKCSSIYMNSQGSNEQICLMSDNNCETRNMFPGLAVHLCT